MLKVLRDVTRDDVKIRKNSQLASASFLWNFVRTYFPVMNRSYKSKNNMKCFRRLFNGRLGVIDEADLVGPPRMPFREKSSFLMQNSIESLNILKNIFAECH